MAALASVAVGAAIAPAASAASKPFKLRAFTDCEAFVESMRQDAARFARPWGIDGVWYATYHLVGEWPTGPGDGGAEPAPAEPAPAEPAASPAKTEGVDYSGTNVQEQGVDEPDIVKTDGDRIFAIADGKLQAIDATGPEPRLLDRLPLGGGWGAELLLHGDRLLVLENGAAPIRPEPEQADGIWGSVPQTARILEVDVSNPRALRVVSTLRVEGYVVSARRVGASVRVVVKSDPSGFDVYYPATPADEPEALARNRASIAASTVANWVPLFQLDEAGGTSRGPAVDCADVRRPPAFSGLGVLNVLTIDLERGLEPVDSDAIVTDGEVVYASPRSLYVATTRWFDRETVQDPDDVPDGIRTLVHKFDIADPAETTYRASGAVRGFLTSQWSMSEHDGYLRVASTDAPPWWGGVSGGESESFVTVLQGRDGVLSRVGRVGGLGRGEWIYAVRFIGDVGYVVTFRQTDPLYTIDLSDPTAPRVRGELKILGYSAYLHPVGDGLLLGVGQDADEDGRVKGTQVSLFDVSDPARPTRIHNLTLGQSWSEAEWDHHAFLYWPRTALTVLPVLAYTVDEQTGVYDYFSGAIGVRVGRAAVERVGTVVHPHREDNPWQAQIRRSLVIGDTLYTLSDNGLGVSSLATLTRRGWLPF